LQVEVGGAGGRWREEAANKKNAMVLSFKTRDASHEKRNQEAEAGREERSRQQQ
jgi:hypothetical protein